MTLKSKQMKMIHLRIPFTSATTPFNTLNTEAKDEIETPISLCPFLPSKVYQILVFCDRRSYTELLCGIKQALQTNWNQDTQEAAAETRGSNMQMWKLLFAILVTLL